MKEILLAFITGLIVGIVFAAFKLPIPAPPAFAGVAGIIGIYFGFKIMAWVGPMLPEFFK
ncbi:XapX domain-containing protein [Halobacillus karajensis]|uniref:XapX domain protein n=1 Tax=Halobacillus karajensis TaxID=195088 RepID=A0A024P3A4_9BACI|nr:DUF1427 family protein [Halobacillus karajensis]CDQ18793.1 XapX domain protein [Halobacillus karajensis]CDQ23134.1 XapX domain protein [Halobacillus karajensis]CDQ26616.1 XapX domain protein [Halobacillus karajensis]SEH46107.1 XapX domain-containing protein [Halobacillus karajensis]